MQKENKKATVRVNVEHNPGAKSSKEYTLHGDWQDIEGVLELAFSSIKKSVNATPLCKVTLEYIPAGTVEEQATAPAETNLEALSKEMQSFKSGIGTSVDKLHAKMDNFLKEVGENNSNVGWTFRALGHDIMNLKNDIKGIRKAVESLADKAEPSGNESEDLHKEEVPQEWGKKMLKSALSKEQQERISQAFAKRVHALKTIGGRGAGKVEAMKALKREIKRLKSEMKSDL